MKKRLEGLRIEVTHLCDLLALALYRFAARRCNARGLRPELLCQHVRGPEPVAKKRRPRCRAEESSASE